MSSLRPYGMALWGLGGLFEKKNELGHVFGCPEWYHDEIIGLRQEIKLSSAQCALIVCTHCHFWDLLRRPPPMATVAWYEQIQHIQRMEPFN